jgi:DNA anti-recombination protein RmuC
MIAQLTPDAVQVAGWLASAFFVAGGINQILKLTDRTKENPPAVEKYWTKAEAQRHREEERERIQQMEQRWEQLRREIRADISRLADSSARRAQELHQRINPLEGHIQALDAKVEEQRQRLAHMDAKLDRLIERSL